MKNFCVSAFALMLAFGTASAFADTVVTVNANDLVYNPFGFTGTIDSGATGNAATISFASPVFGALFTIDLTNASGQITDVLMSGTGTAVGEYYGDAFEFFGFNSGNSLIGTTCVASGSVACVENTGGVINVSPLVGQFNGGDGIFLGGTLTVQADDAGTFAATPEPSSLMLLGTGLAGTVGVMRRRMKRS